MLVLHVVTFTLSFKQLFFILKHVIIFIALQHFNNMNDNTDNYTCKLGLS